MNNSMINLKQMYQNLINAKNTEKEIKLLSKKI